MAFADKKDDKVNMMHLPDLKLVEVSDKNISSDIKDAKPLKHSAIDEIHKLILENVRLLKEEDNAATA